MLVVFNVGHRVLVVFHVGHRVLVVFHVGHQVLVVFNVGHRVLIVFHVGHRVLVVFHLGIKRIHEHKQQLYVWMKSVGHMTYTLKAIFSDCALTSNIKPAKANFQEKSG